MGDHDSYETDLGSYSLDPEDQLQPEDTLLDRGVVDSVDEGYVANDRPSRPTAQGITAEDLHRVPSLDDRILQEEPDLTLEYADDEELAEDEGFTEEYEVGDARAGRLVAAHDDTSDEAIAFDIGIDGGAASAEEAAMHIVSDAELLAPEDLSDLMPELAAEGGPL